MAWPKCSLPKASGTLGGGAGSNAKKEGLTHEHAHFPNLLSMNSFASFSSFFSPPSPTACGLRVGSRTEGGVVHVPTPPPLMEHPSNPEGSIVLYLSGGNVLLTFLLPSPSFLFVLYVHNRHTCTSLKRHFRVLLFLLLLLPYFFSLAGVCVCIYLYLLLSPAPPPSLLPSPFLLDLTSLWFYVNRKRRK